MFITLIRVDNKLAARVHLEEDNPVEITAEQEALRKLLEAIYQTIMTPIEFTEANYRLDYYRKQGMTWELFLDADFLQQWHTSSC